MISSMWRCNRPLGLTSVVMLVDFVVTLIGLAIDPRYIGGAPAWLKPAKFAISTAIYAGSIAWLFQYLPDFQKTTRWIGLALAIILTLEVGLIDFQAARGRTSHFNTGSVQDALIYSIMGTAIFILLVLSIWITVLLFRQTFQDASWGWALRLGMLLTVLGSASGGLMTSPTRQQLNQMRYEPPKVMGSHTVGAPDGGPGIAGVGWSKQHGDLRIPHFLGLHALQIIPLAAWWRRRRFVKSAQDGHGAKVPPQGLAFLTVWRHASVPFALTTVFVFATAGSYLALYLIFLWQALRGESIAEPSVATLTALGVWLAATLVAVFPWQRHSYHLEALHER